MKLYIKIIIHSIYWIVFVAFTARVEATTAYEIFQTELLRPAIHIGINTLWAIAIFYLFYFYFIKFFEAAQFVKYLLFSILLSIGISLLFNPLHKIFISSYRPFHFHFLAPPIIGTFIIAQCGSLVRGFENWVKNIKLKAELENRNLKTELELLKSQINPHFLFNTIHNIDALIHKSPDDASKSLLNLSDMLRYMIYETNVDFVPLEKEVEYLQHYITLQKLRLSKPELLQIDLPKNCGGVKVAPMLFLPFVENTFKYASFKSDFPAVEINLTFSDKQLNFVCENVYKEINTSKSHTGGVGLENVKRRLELIYPNKHELKTSKENGIFRAELKLKLL